MSRVAILSQDFFKALQPQLKGLPKNVRKLRILLENNKPALMTVEMYAVPLGSGKIITKEYEVCELGSCESREEQEIENGCVDVTTLSDTTTHYAIPIKGDA